MQKSEGKKIYKFYKKLQEKVDKIIEEYKKVNILKDWNKKIVKNKNIGTQCRST